MCQPETPVFTVRPIFRSAVLISVRRNHLPFKHHCLDVKVIVLTNGEKPNVFRAVLPIRLGPAPLFALPGDSVLRDEVFFTDAMNRCGAAPVTADVNRSR